MISIEVEGKKYDLKRRMTRFEVKQVEQYLSKFANLEKLVVENEDEAAKLISSTTPAEETLIDEIVANCVGISKDSVYKEMEFIHEILLFGAILEASIPRKNLFLPSEKPTTVTTSPPSTE